MAYLWAYDVGHYLREVFIRLCTDDMHEMKS